MTTTLRLPDRLKDGVAAAAKRAGKTPHAYMVDAIAEKVDQEQRRTEFHDEAERRFHDLVASGRTLPWSDVRAYLRARATGKPTRRPKASKQSG